MIQIYLFYVAIINLHWKINNYPNLVIIILPFPCLLLWYSVQIWLLSSALRVRVWHETRRQSVPCPAPHVRDTSWINQFLLSQASQDLRIPHLLVLLRRYQYWEYLKITAKFRALPSNRAHYTYLCHLVWMVQTHCRGHWTHERYQHTLVLCTVFLVSDLWLCVIKK